MLLEDLNFLETWNNKIQQLNDNIKLFKFYRGFQLLGGKKSKQSDRKIMFYRTKYSSNTT